MTGGFFSFCFLFYVVFLMKYSNYGSTNSRIIFILIFSLFGYYLIILFFSYLFIPELFDYYLNNSIEPIMAYFNLPLSKMLFGVGPNETISNYSRAIEIGIIRQAFRLGGAFYRFYLCITDLYNIYYFKVKIWST